MSAITCPEYVRRPGSKLCAYFYEDAEGKRYGAKDKSGACAIPDNFICTEFMKTFELVGNSQLVTLRRKRPR